MTDQAPNTYQQPVTAPDPAAVPAPTAGGVSHAGGAMWQAGGLPISSTGKRFGALLLESVLMLCTLYIGWLIWSLIVWSKGQTPAKALLGMRCVRTDTGRAATWGTMALREVVGKGIIGSITFGITTLVSCFMILGATHQGVWDKVASTVVVDDPTGRLLAA